MQKTSIEWVRNPDGTQGYTWNPITGCLNHINGLCKGGGFPCYAYKLAHGRLWSVYLNNHTLAPTASGICKADDTGIVKVSGDYLDPFYPRFWEERLWKPRYHRKEAGIFPCDMSDLFGIGIPEEWTRQVLRVCRLCSWHRFYLLTKQSQNLIKFSPFPDNCWVGVTATDTGMAYKAVNNLRRIEAKVKYMSFEPLLGRIINWIGDAEYLFKDLDWLIIGAQTNPYKPPKIEWVEEIVRAADKAGVAVFLKDNLEPLWTLENRREPFFKFSRSSPGATEIGRLRQELPNVTR